MPEYIERDRALEIVKRTSGDYATAWSEIGKLPAADVEPVKRAKWEFNGIHTFCSVCGSGRPTKALDHKISGRETRFCYYCGAKMK